MIHPKRTTEPTTEGTKAILKTIGTTFKLGVMTAAPGGGSAQKRFLHADGQAKKDASHSQALWAGRFNDRSVLGMGGLAELIGCIRCNQALTLGSRGLDATQTVVSGEKIKEFKQVPENTITRSLKYLTFPENQPFYLLIDVDVEPGATEKLDRDGLIASLSQIIPGFENVGFVETQSSSSNIYDRTTGECLKGRGNFHLFIAAIGDVVKFRENLKLKLWAAGKGFFKEATPHKHTGRSQILERFPIDLSVFSPERLVFEAGPKLPDSLEWRPGKPLFQEGTILNLDAVVATDEEIALAKTNRTRSRKPFEDKRITETAAKVRTAQPSLSESEAKTEARRLIKNDESAILPSDFELYFQDGRTVLAGDLDTSHLQCGLQDPLEPDYRNWSYCAKIIHLPGGAIGVSSFAHGVCRKFSVAPKEDTGESQDNDDSGGHDFFTRSLYTVNKQGVRKLRSQDQIGALLATAWGDLKFDDSEKQWYEYKQGLWAPITPAFVKQRITQTLRRTEIGFSTSFKNGIAEFLEEENPVQKWQESRGFIPLGNGILDLSDMALMSHSPHYGYRWKLPYNYDPAATCEPIIEWLRFTQFGDEDRVQLLRAYLRAAILGGSNLQRFLEVISTAGGSGKSTFCNLAIGLVGSENVWVTSSNALERPFETANFKNKKLVYFADSGRYAGDKAIDCLKRLTGGDSIQYEKKGKQACEPFKFGGMILISANQPIVTTDPAIPRRRLSVPFLRAIQNRDQRDLLEFDPITGELSGDFADHMPGLLNWVLSMTNEEMRGYLKDTDRLVPGLASVKGDTLIATNPMAAWFDEKCIFDDSAKTLVGSVTRTRHSEGGEGSSASYEKINSTGDYLYPNYIEYCEQRNQKPESAVFFSDKLQNLAANILGKSNVVKKRGGAGFHLVGIALRTIESDAPRPISEAVKEEEEWTEYPYEPD